MNIAGFSLSNWITFAFSYMIGGRSWRFPLAFRLVFSIIIIIIIIIIILYETVPWLPESPRWLIVHEYEDEAFTILADHENKPEDDPFIITQHREILYTIQAERENAVGWGQLLTGRPIHHSLYSEIRKPLRVNTPKLASKRSLRKCGGTAVLTQLSSDEAAASVFPGKCRNRPILRTRLSLDQMSCGTGRRCDTLSGRTYSSLVTGDTSS